MRRKLTFVVCGGGPTGVEFCAELSDFLEQDVRREYHDIYAHASVILVEGNEILPMFAKTLRDYTLKKLRKRKVDVRLGRMVTEVDQDHIYLSDGTALPHGVLIWSGGVRSRDFIKALPFPHNKPEQILTDNFLRVKDQTHIFAMGDCSDMEENSLPPTAAVAVRQGKWLAKLFNSEFDMSGTDKLNEGFKFNKMGSMAYTGSWSAVVDLGDKAIRIPLRGFFAFAMWRFGYLSMQGNWRNVLWVPFDWIRTWIFGRDLTRFGEFYEGPSEKAFRKLDTNKDGTLSFQEILIAYPEIEEKRLRELFEIYDDNNNNKLEFHEFVNFCQRIWQGDRQGP